ncbi:hypothetical protein CC2G_014506 [Coprinopsis cinerea AmutBmut pab1-1]|nr:hypothetical protein CC2G_014506 [Coprinopsis cinerea AmutBmut pab1-1]
MEDGEANGGCQNKDGQDVDEEKRSGEGKETGTNAEDGEKTESGGGVDDPRSEDRGDDQVEKPAEDTSTSTAEVTSDSPIENAEGEASKPQNGEAAPQTPAHDLSTANGCGSEESAETPGVPLSDAAEKGSNQGEVTDTTEEANEDDEELPDDGEDEIQIITQSLEEPRNGNLVWYMSKRWKEKMVEEGWEVVAYRDDYRIIVTTSSPASEWTVYDPEDHTCTEECLGGHELPGESKE